MHGIGKEGWGGERQQLSVSVPKLVPSMSAPISLPRSVTILESVVFLVLEVEERQTPDKP